MKKIRRYVPRSVLKTLYSSLILSRLSYGIKAWGFAHAKVFKIQKKAVRILTYSKYSAHTSPLFKSEKLLKIQDIFNINCLSFHYKIENKMTPAYFERLTLSNWDIHEHFTRRRRIRQTKTNFASTKSCLRHYLPELIFDLPEDLLNQIFSVKITTFKEHVKSFFINGYDVLCTKRVCQVCGTNLLL